MAVAIVSRIGSGKIDWLGRADDSADAIAEAATQHDTDESFVSEGYQLLKREGFFKALIPAELGGGGADYAEIGSSIRRIGTSCGATALAFAMHSHLVAAAAWRWRHQNAPTDGFLKRVAAEDLILVSSGGSDWLKSAGIATKTDGGYLQGARFHPLQAPSDAPPVDVLRTASGSPQIPLAGGRTQRLLNRMRCRGPR